jgi:hypothetical protein
MHFLHKDLKITSDKQKSSQGSVFYFKFNRASLNANYLQANSGSQMGSDEDKQVECILKVVSGNNYVAGV